MNFHNLDKNTDKYLFLISIFTILLFFFGFYLQENSAGAGGFNGDFYHVWNNLTLFKNNNFLDALITTGLNEYKYKSNRPPLIYILNAYFNPLQGIKEIFFQVFLFFFFTYILFFYSLKKIYINHINNFYIFILSSIILLSPYFRTSFFGDWKKILEFFQQLSLSFFFNKIKFENEKNRTINLFFATFLVLFVFILIKNF